MVGLAEVTLVLRSRPDVVCTVLLNGKAVVVAAEVGLGTATLVLREFDTCCVEFEKSGGAT